jgi:hypothetical protein
MEQLVILLKIFSPQHRRWCHKESGKYFFGSKAVYLLFIHIYFRGDTLGNLFVAAEKRVLKISASNNLVTTLAGNPSKGISGENIAATSILLKSVERVRGDTVGNIYFIDACRIRKFSVTTGLVASVIGPGFDNCGYNGENKTSTMAILYNPISFWLDTVGNIIVADSLYRIRKLTSSTQFVNTIAGNGNDGLASESGPAVDSPVPLVGDIVGDTNGNIYFSSALYNYVWKITNSGQIELYLKIEAGLNHPIGLYLDTSGYLYVAESRRIRKYTSASSSTVIAGDANCFGSTGDSAWATNACISQDTNSFWADTTGAVYLAQPLYYKIRKVSTSGIITTFSGTGFLSFAGDDGPAIDAQLNDPQGTFLDTNGNVYIADGGNCRIRLVNPSGIISTFAGTGNCAYNGDNVPLSTVSLFNPHTIWQDSMGNLYISEENAVLKVSAASNVVTTIAGKGTINAENVTATSYSMSNLWGIWGDTVNNLYISELTRHRVKKLSLTTSLIVTIAGTTTGFVDNVPATSSKLKTPRGVWVDTLGRLFIADSLNHRIRKVENGFITTFAGTTSNGNNGNGHVATATKFETPYGVFGDTNGNIFLAENINNKVRMVSARNNTANIVTTVLGVGSSSPINSRGWYLATSARLSHPQHVALDTNGVFYVCEDNKSNYIRKMVLLSAPTGQPSGQPSGKPSKQPMAAPSSLPTNQPTTV